MTAMGSPAPDDSAQARVRKSTYDEWRQMVRREKGRRLGRWWLVTAVAAAMTMGLAICATS